MKTIRFLIVGFAATTAAFASNSSGNDAIMRYLGEPVSAPAKLAVEYSPQGIEDTFKALCAKHGVKIQTVAVDSREFPHLVYGRLDGGREFFRQIETHMKTLPGYAYAGSVVGGTREGVTFFALNMTPNGEYPKEHAEAIRRRQMVRLQMLAHLASTAP